MQGLHLRETLGDLRQEDRRGEGGVNRHDLQPLDGPGGGHERVQRLAAVLWEHRKGDSLDRPASDDFGYDGRACVYAAEGAEIWHGPGGEG